MQMLSMFTVMKGVLQDHLQRKPVILTEQALSPGRPKTEPREAFPVLVTLGSVSQETCMNV